MDELESAIANYEMAYRMQAAVPELIDVKGETQATRKLYGLDSKYDPTRTFGMQCLIARRLVEKGVRFIELTCPRISGGNDRWDAHGGLKKNHGDNPRNRPADCRAAARREISRHAEGHACCVVR